MQHVMNAVETEALQQPVEALPGICWDTVVVGAGPAGSTAAYLLAKKGFRVLLLDRASFPREKTCGDALIPDSIHALGRLGVLPEVRRLARRVSEAVIFSPSQIEVPVRGEYLTLKRRTLDAVLARHAARSGATFCRGQVRGIEAEGGGPIRLAVEETDAPLKARFAVLATGSDVTLLARLGMLTRPRPSAIALRSYVRSAVDLDRLIISYDRSITPGYAWIFPLGGGEYNVGCGVFYRKKDHERLNLREMFNRFLAEFPPARGLMRNASSMTPLRGAPLRCSLSGAHVLGGNRVVAVGEAMGATFPLTGEGIGKAMETGELAAAALEAALATGSHRKLHELPWKVRTELLPRYVGYEIGERWLCHSWLNDFLAWRAHNSPLLQKLLEGIIVERVDPRRLFSMRGILSSWWR